MPITMMSFVSRASAAVAGCAVLLPLLRAQDPVPRPQVDREAMWPAPTAEDWQKPVLIQWQRTWEDALAVAEETGKPLLVCINMDGEIASEHYAGIRYRQPDIAKLYEPYVCVIASVYRHNPRDFDEHGHRIPCPRFGGVTCGEHIAIEPILFEKFMDGQRIAPRHIMVELDGKEQYDVFYAWDTASVFKAIGDGIANRTLQPKPIVKGDRSILQRVASRDSTDKSAVEQAWSDADAEQRRAMLEAAIACGEQAPVDLLRLGVFGLDLELSAKARQALLQAQSPGAVDLIGAALRQQLAPKERDALVGALEKLGEASPQASRLAAVHKGLSSRTSALDVEGWTRALAGSGTYAPAPDPLAVEARVDRVEAVAQAQPADATAQVELAEALLALATEGTTGDIVGDGKAGEMMAKLRFEDAYRAAKEAEKLGAEAWRASAAIAVAAHHLGRQQEALEYAAKAVSGMPPDASSPTAMRVLALFAEARQRAIADAIREKQRWPSQWLTDVHAAYSVLARHPLGTDIQVVDHYDFLSALGGAARAARVLDEGLARFPDSWLLHDRLRARLLEEKGVAGLEPAYEAMLQQADASPNLRWFAGYTSIVAAEFHRRARHADEALAAYDRAIAHYDAFAQAHPEQREGCDHYVALALAGRARIALERSDLDAALRHLLASLERRAASAATLDGLNVSPADTARTLLARLKEQQKTELVTELETALSKLDPELLQLPAYERGGVPPPRRRRR